MSRRKVKGKVDKNFEIFRQQVARALDVGANARSYQHHSYTWRPPTDIYDTKSAVIVKSEIAGLTKDDFKVTYIDQVLTIQGTRKDTEEKLNYHCMEIQYDNFQVRFLLRGIYDTDNISINYENGFLYIILPKLKVSMIVTSSSEYEIDPIINR